MPRITTEKLDELKSPTLEDLLAVMNNGKYDKFFLRRPKEFPDGSRQFMTRKGSKMYGRLTSILYAVARLTDVSMAHAVETLDAITREEA